jgi:L-seryl-tRNA(Ser) seleniumtransferase
MTDPRRRIPAIDTLLSSSEFASLVARAGRARVLETLRGIQAEVRQRPPAGDEALEDERWYAALVAARLDGQDQPSLRRVINATGVVLHTNLGRAPLAEPARRAVAQAAGYGTLELDLASGARGSRHDHCVGLLQELTGAEAALVVNNNAAAVVLALNTLALGAEVVVSRGELVEIGGSFRVPEIMASSGARLREVGATNRTHPADYRDALGPDTGLILKVHRSNFSVQGFTAEVAVQDLAGIGREAGLPVVHDLGSGALMDLTILGLPAEPTARQALEAGADVVTLSGDKLLGGPQAGIVLGRADLVERMRRNPLCRAMRCDKLTLSALEATLALYRDPERARRQIPVLAMLSENTETLARRADTLARRIRDTGGQATTAAATSAVGGGAMPGVELPTTVVVLAPRADSADSLARRLRQAATPVVARIRDGAVLLDPRTVDSGDEDALVEAVLAALEPGG